MSITKGCAAIVAVGMLVAGGSACASERIEIVKFKAGTTATNLHGSIRGYDGVTYKVATGAGQVMHVLFSPSNRSCYFNAYAPGKEPGKDTAAFVGSTSGNEFGINPTAAGSYRLQVYLMRNAARRKETCKYQLSIEITGKPGGISAGVSDQMMADACKGSAAQMYGVQPRKVTLESKIVAGGSGFMLDGRVDKGPEGIKKLRCIYKADRQFSHIQAMTSDGE